jgi:hypothetical protein
MTEKQEKKRSNASGDERFDEVEREIDQARHDADDVEHGSFYDERAVAYVDSGETPEEDDQTITPG